MQAMNAENVSRPDTSFYDLDDAENYCFLCAKPDYTPLCRPTHFDFAFEFKQCQCGLIKQTPMPNEKFFEWFFNSDVFFSSKKTDKEHIWGYYDYFADEPSRLATSKRRYRKLKYIFGTDASLNVMKIGPATGTFLYMAKEGGHNVLGCDVSSRFAEYARSNYGVEIDIGRFESKPYKDAQFDVLVLFNVIENVPNLDEFMQAIARTVKPGGHFLLNFVDMDRNLIAALQKDKYFIYRPPVCYAFTFTVLRRMLAKYGFEVERWHYDIRHMHLEKIATLLGWRWLHSLGRVLRVSRIPFPIHAYPSRIVVARRCA